MDAMHRFALQGAVLAACGALSIGGLNLLHAAVEPPIIPTVHPTLAPSGIITAGLKITANDNYVWRSGSEQRIYVRGNVTIEFGYRRMLANEAVIWLTPSREGGDSVFDAAIFLNENVRLQQMTKSGKIETNAAELLVTARISGQVQLVATPESKGQEELAAYKRGQELRQELLMRPAPAVHIPRITIVEAEEALQAGWIARGPGNRLIAGPAEILAARQQGRGTGGAGTQPGVELGPDGQPIAKVVRPRPQVFATGDRIEYKTVDGERVTVIRNAYLMRDTLDGKPPIELRAQQMVLFSPPENQPTATQPGAATAPAPARAGRIVTGAYLEGDVTLDAGPQQVRAERIYYDFTSDRAVMLDAVLSAVDEQRNVPLYMRAAEIRQTARGEFAAKNANFSTSEFATPHYAIGADSIYLRDVTPRDEKGRQMGLTVYEFGAKDTTFQVKGQPIFWWPYVSGTTDQSELPLRRIRASNSTTYGLSLQTDWDLFGLAGQRAPQGTRFNLSLDYFGERGAGAGVDGRWADEDSRGLLRSYAMIDNGEDRLGRDRKDLEPEDNTRGRITARHQTTLDGDWTLQLEGTFISDPTFLEQYFGNEYAADKEQETVIYLKRARETEALSLLGKWNLMDFTANADLVDDQFTTQKLPEFKYWRIGDSFFDAFTYYSESGIANLDLSITNYTPAQLGYQASFLGFPAAATPSNQTFRDYYRSIGWTDNSVLRGDTRHELVMPLQVGDAKIAPYVTGRFTAWDDSFVPGDGGNTTRLWGGGGIRSSMAFWRTYDDIRSTFWDVNRIRHLIEPQFHVFAVGSDVDRRELLPFDRDVEGISTASGTSLSINQKWQTKRGGPGHWRNVDWLVLNVAWNQFFSEPDTGTYYAGNPIRGFWYPSRPDLSLVRDSIAVDGVWRVGERARIIGEFNYNLDSNRIEQYAMGLAIDQTSRLSYFIGNRYVSALDTNEVTFAVDYLLTRKYRVVGAQSYDFEKGTNILSSLTLVRQFPRVFMAVTVTYDANIDDTTFALNIWPEGYAELGFGSRSLRESSAP